MAALGYWLLNIGPCSGIEAALVFVKFVLDVFSNTFQLVYSSHRPILACSH